MIWIDGEAFEVGRYPNHEAVLRGLDPARLGQSVRLTWRYDDDADLVALYLVGRHLREARPDAQLSLHLLYLPYSRMDHVDGPGTVLSLAHAAELINAISADEVVLYEPHSARSLELVKNSRAEYPTLRLVERTLDLMAGTRNVWLVYPDAGARARYTTHAGRAVAGTLVGAKRRDFDTGRITGLTVEWPEDFDDTPGKVAVIADDLCSRGGTFLAVASQLRARGFSTVLLCVTHLEANAHTGELFAEGSAITRVITTDALNPDVHRNHPQISIYEMDK